VFCARLALTSKGRHTVPLACDKPFLLGKLAVARDLEDLVCHGPPSLLRAQCTFFYILQQGTSSFLSGLLGALDEKFI